MHGGHDDATTAVLRDKGGDVYVCERGERDDWTGNPRASASAGHSPLLADTRMSSPFPPCAIPCIRHSLSQTTP